MANGDPDDCDIGEELTLAMEEITENEKDYKSLIEITTCLFERSQDLSLKESESSN